MENKWELGKVPNGFWDVSSNRIDYMNWLGNKLGFKSEIDWYNVKREDFDNNKGCGFIRYYNRSPSAAVMHHFNYDFKPWLFRTAPMGYWENKLNSKKYMEWLKVKLGYSCMNDWYKIDKNCFIKNSGQGMLYTLFDNSPSKAVVETYPEYNWNEWMFKSVPQGWWKNKDNRLKYCKWLENKFGINKTEDWYFITQKQIKNYYGNGFLDSCGSFYAALISTIDYDWDYSKFDETSKNQILIYQLIKQNIPNEDVKFNFKHPDLIFASSKRKMELDIYIPSYKLAIEYQGGSHFKSIDFFGGETAYQKILIRDQEKKIACQKNNIKLIEITYKDQVDNNFIVNILKDYYECN